MLCLQISRNSSPVPLLLASAQHARHLLSIADPENRCEWFTINFSTAGNLTELHHGDFVQNEWLDTQGVKVEASSGEHSDCTPNGMARIFDTSMKDMLDADLESPNHKLVAQELVMVVSQAMPARIVPHKETSSSFKSQTRLPLKTTEMAAQSHSPL